MNPLSYVVTGGGRGVGRAVVERLAADGGTVVVVERDTSALDWLARHPLADRLHAVTGDAGDEAVTGRAADRAEPRASGRLGQQRGGFRDAALHARALARARRADHAQPGARGGRSRRRATVPGRGTRARSSTSPPTRPAGPCRARCRTRPPRRRSRG